VAGWASTAPQAMKNLVQMITVSQDLAALTAQLDGPVKVKDMGDLTDADAQVVVTVGYLNPEEDAHAEAAYTSGDLSSATNKEDYTIHCGLAVGWGDEGDAPGCRDMAFAVLAAVGRVCVADQTLRGVAMNAGINGWTLRMDQTTGGLRAQLDFGIAVSAFTNR
jgi:hypothetical protein